MFEYSSIKPENLNGIDLDEINRVTIQGIDFRYNGRSKLLEDKFLFILGKGMITTLLEKVEMVKPLFAEIPRKL